MRLLKVSDWARGKLCRVVAPRELFFRSNDHIRYFRLSSRAQAVLLASTVVVSVGLLSSGIAAGFYSLSAKAMTQELEQEKLAYVDLKLSLGDGAPVADHVNLDYGDQAPAAQNWLGEDNTKQLALQLAAAERNLDQSNARHQQLAMQLSERDSILEELGQERSLLRASLAQANSRIALLERRLAEAGSENQALLQKISTSQSHFKELAARNESIKSQKDTAENDVAAMKEQMAAYSDANQRLMRRVWDHTETALEALEKTVSMTGIALDEVLADQILTAKADSQGGPFIAAETDTYEELDRWLGADISLSALDARFTRWAALQEVMTVLPLAPPMEQFRITSSFGTRIDPLNGRQARHDGMDFAAPFKSSVYATAPGKVVFAGWRGHYGRVVEIDHGHGLKTVYSHLNAILVKKGENVDSHQKIGLLGSSGRSTGPHVHYEVRFKGKPLDPAKFLTAGKYVFKS